MKFKDYYKILGLENSKVTIDQIKVAYRKQAKKYHPDVNVGNKLAEERIKDINEAYRMLSNATTKRKYDRTWNYNIGYKQKRARQKTSSDVAGEFFGMFFGNNEIKEEIAQSKIPPVKGENIETEINITIEDGFYGTEKTIALKNIEGKTKTITVKIPEGIQDGEKIRLIGQGKTGKNGGKNGDLYIKINIDDGKKYKLNGSDLYTTIPISPWEAALGTKAKVNSIDDTKTAIYIPNGVQSGETIEIPQKGYRTPKGERGNLIAQIQIVVPEKLTKEEKEMFKKLKEISKFNPRRV
ncbi:MAG: DnaJ C-terminal domain-containing protein [Clostridia bacterium]